MEKKKLKDHLQSLFEENKIKVILQELKARLKTGTAAQESSRKQKNVLPLIFLSGISQLIAQYALASM